MKKKKKGKAGAVMLGILIGLVGTVCIGAVTVATAGAINGNSFNEQIVVWAGGEMPVETELPGETPEETVTPGETVTPEETD